MKEKAVNDARVSPPRWFMRYAKQTMKSKDGKQRHAQEQIQSIVYTRSGACRKEIQKL